MLLNNIKVAKFLGIDYCRMLKLISLGKLSLGVVSKGKERNHYYIIRADLERLIGRKLMEEEYEELRKY